MIKRFSWRIRVLFVFIVGMSAIQYLNFTGFCYKEFRYLSNLELTDAWIRMNRGGGNSSLIIDDQTIQRSKEGYPSCCRVTGEYYLMDDTLKFLNKFLGYYYYEVDANFPKRGANLRSGEEYYEYNGSVNACGTGTGPYNTGMSTDKKWYDFKLEHIGKLWEGVKQ